MYHIENEDLVDDNNDDVGENDGVVDDNEDVVDDKDGDVDDGLDDQPHLVQEETKQQGVHRCQPGTSTSNH